MLDIKKIRNNSENVKKSLIRKDKDLSIDHILHLDNNLKALTTKLNDLQAEQNSKSKEVGILKSKGDSAELVFKDLKVLSDQIKDLEKEQRELSSNLKNALLEIPNTPHETSPDGISEKDNVIVSEHGTKKDFNF